MERFAIHKSYAAPAAVVRNVFWDVEQWQRIWNPVSRVDVLYDDRQFQEFQMGLLWRGRPITIRTIRMKQPNGDIGFFSPNPPGEFSHHTGSWRFHDEEGRGHCAVVAEREFIVRRLEGESSEDYETRQRPICAAFRERVTRLLDAFDPYFAQKV